MHPYILAIGTAVPPNFIKQEEVPDILKRTLNLDESKYLSIKQAYRDTAIHKRHTIVDDFNSKDRTKWNFLSQNYPHSVPSMSERTQLYKKEAHKLAFEACKKTLESWNGCPKQITHVISVSCTGVMAPGIEFDLIRLLNLKPSINRLGINFMGCFGAFKGMDVARAYAKESPDHRVLVVCTELCSLHFQADFDPETIVGNSLFADGAAAIIVGSDPQPFETPMREIVHMHSMGIENSLDKISWEASDRGYLMRLHHTVPVWIGRHIQNFTEGLLLAGVEPKNCDWAIHPGGKSIIRAIEKKMQINVEQTQAAWKTLNNYGNMSSATFLFVLEELFKQACQQEWAIGVAFGPGLSMEGTLLRKPS